MTTYVARRNTGRGNQAARFPELPGVAASLSVEWDLTTRERWCVWILSLLTEACERLRGDDGAPILEGRPQGAAVRGAWRAAQTAAVLAAFCGNEVGWGEYEWNGNVANVHCVDGQTAECVRFSSSDEMLAAYRDGAEGATAFVGLVRARYAAAWLKAAQGDLGAVLSLYATGYVACGSMSRDEVRSLYRRIYDAQRAEVQAWLQTPDAIALTGEDFNVPCPRGSRRTGSRGSSSSSSGARAGGLFGLAALGLGLYYATKG